MTNANRETICHEIFQIISEIQKTGKPSFTGKGMEKETRDVAEVFNLLNTSQIDRLIHLQSLCPHPRPQFFFKFEDLWEFVFLKLQYIINQTRSRRLPLPHLVFNIFSKIEELTNPIVFYFFLIKICLEVLSLSACIKNHADYAQNRFEQKIICAFAIMFDRYPNRICRTCKLLEFVCHFSQFLHMFFDSFIFYSHSSTVQYKVLQLVDIVSNFLSKLLILIVLQNPRVSQRLQLLQTIFSFYLLKFHQQLCLNNDQLILSISWLIQSNIFMLPRTRLKCIRSSQAEEVKIRKCQIHTGWSIQSRCILKIR